MQTDQLILALLSLVILALLCAVFLQQRQLRFRHRSQIQQMPKSFSDGFALLESFPEPLIVISHSGKILLKTASFNALPAPYASVRHLDEIDQHSGTRLRERLADMPGTARFELQFRIRGDGSDVERLPFLAVSWPVNVPNAAHGRAIAFFPQTLSRRRQREYPLLERQLVEYITSCSQELAHLSQLPAGLQGVTIRAQQMAELAHYLDTVHGPLRAQRVGKAVVLSAVTNTAIKVLRVELRIHELHLISTVGSSLEVLAYPDDLQLLLGLLLQLSITTSPSKSNMRLDAVLDKKHVVMKIEHTRKPADLPGDFQKMQLLLAKQLSVKLGATLKVTDGHDLTRQYQVSLRAA